MHRKISFQIYRYAINFLNFFPKIQAEFMSYTKDDYFIIISFTFEATITRGSKIILIFLHLQEIF